MKHVPMIVISLLTGLLVLTLLLDPRVDHYDSTYDPQATKAEIDRWFADLRDFRKSPTYARFGHNPPEDPLGKPDFAATYVFGKFAYEVQLQIRGNRMHYISWGVDQQVDGGAWYSVGEGTLQENGEWFSVWSCLDLSREVSNGGGAWFRFNRDRSRIDVRYYHDTLPFGNRPVELGEAVLKERHNPNIPLEGRVPTFTPTVTAPQDEPFALWGRVVDETGAGVEGAAVKRRAAGRIETVTNSRGFFKLELDQLEALTLVTAGKLGYVNGIVTLEQEAAFRSIGPDGQVSALATITLRKMSPIDHRDYNWIAPDHTPRSTYSPENHMNCGNCHRREYDHWRTSRHASMARNPWTRAAFEKDARPHALAQGNATDECTPCHSPSLASTLGQFSLHGTTLLDAHGVHLSGNHCDFCHKIESVPNPYAAGVNGSLRLLRPDPHDDTFPGPVKRVFGPLPDVSYLYMGAGYNPIFEMGVLCASCHEHKTESGLVGQGTWSEWQRTRYAKPGADYKECQDCHMPEYSRTGRIQQILGPDGKMMTINVGGDLTQAELDGGGVAIARFATRFRPLSEGHKHAFVGSEDVAFLKAGVKMNVETQRFETGLRVVVALENVGAGHAIPTGHGLKRYVLGVTGFANGVALESSEGLPADERVGETATATQGALIGRRFAEDWATPYWRAAREVEDTRLWPDEPSIFIFDLPGATEAEVKLVLRRGSPALLREHGMPMASGLAGGGKLDTLVHRWRGK